MNIMKIEELTTVYSGAREDLSTLVRELELALSAIRQSRIASIKSAVKRAIDARDDLHAAIEEAPEIFTKPRTRIFSGIKVGINKQRGKVVIDNEEKTIELIRKLLPEDQAELLIRIKEEVHKPSVYDLEARDLKRLGIKITADTDETLIKPVDGEVDKLVDALLKEAEEQ